MTETAAARLVQLLELACERVEKSDVEPFARLLQLRQYGLGMIDAHAVLTDDSLTVNALAAALDRELSRLDPRWASDEIPEHPTVHQGAA